jgi:hypothetical protein
VECGWWKEACRASGTDFVSLPAPDAPGGNAHASDLSARLASGAGLVAQAHEAGCGVILDNAGAGLAFVAGAGGDGDLRLAHEAANLPLVSHFIDPIPTSFAGLHWPAVWTCLSSLTWTKAVWDRAHAEELKRFGVPNVVHLPMAAPNRRYRTEPLDPRALEPVVSFVGGQNSNYFSPDAAVATGDLFAGALAHAVRGDLRAASFFDVYHELYALAAPLASDDDAATRAAKVAAYYKAKLFYHAQLNVRNRDRFVIFLKRTLGDGFRLIGRNWDRVYGLTTAPPLPGGDAFFDHFRRVTININLVSGNAETGLNMRHFEITAAGGFMLCYDQPELADHFEIGRECDVFHDERELLQKVRFYLDHPGKAAEIALAGQRRSLSSHLHSHRLAAITRALTPATLAAAGRPVMEPVA